MIIDFQALSDNLNIPVLRKTIHTAWLNVLIKPLTNIQSMWLERVNGSSRSTFNSTNNYSVNNSVRYSRANYVCILTPPTGLFPLPTNTTYWYKFTDDYIGIAERSYYSAQKVMLEYALNKRFSPSTITPPFGSSIPSIYIQNNILNIVPILYSAPSSTNTNSWTAPNSSGSFWYSSLGNPSTTPVYNFTVFVPTAIMTSINTNLSQAIYLVRQEVDKYNTAGIKYDVQQY
ncbi:hypothetical protein UFOVP87_22 [uncultured Caudovirales phage]|uniref:Uncharacterized protein n=1 Tax=uncultured Caudovirales phage TaxID=2100421 RepID=A0A6J5L0W2_9CAUD|nr:hypothetical protein UFOVP87_22 [uncultured Caudovirales phage]